MKYLTKLDIEKIQKINETLNTRYEYLDAIANILKIETTGIRRHKRVMKGIALDESTELDIVCRTVKGQMIIKEINIVDWESKPIEAQYFTFRKNKWFKTFPNFESGKFFNTFEEL